MPSRTPMDQGTCSIRAASRGPPDAGWLAVGDATAAFDPLSSHGLTSAL
jgi:hypothetical protein